METNFEHKADGIWHILYNMTIIVKQPQETQLIVTVFSAHHDHLSKMQVQNKKIVICSIFLSANDFKCLQWNKKKKPPLLTPVVFFVVLMAIVKILGV